MIRNFYIVPHDFTDVGDAALKFAINLGKKVKTEIQLVHVVAEKTKLIAAKQKLEKIAASCEKTNNIEITTKVVLGNIFEDIGKLAKKEGAQLIIMGTHGLTTMQKLFGSNVIKVVTSSSVPFLIVQKDTVIKEISNIIVPIDMTRESLQVTNLAGDLSKIFGAKVHVVVEKQNDEDFAKKLVSRINIVTDQFEERSVDSVISYLDESGSYLKKVINYTKKNNGDFLALAYHTESMLPMFDTFAQNVVVNELKLPCLIVNSKSASNLYF
jgi:nucleotide-binding universal stress UspA family protein